MHAQCVNKFKLKNNNNNETRNIFSVTGENFKFLDKKPKT